MKLIAFTEKVKIIKFPERIDKESNSETEINNLLRVIDLLEGQGEPYSNERRNLIGEYKGLRLDIGAENRKIYDEEMAKRLNKYFPAEMTH